QYVPEKGGSPNVSFRRWRIDGETCPVDVSEFDQIFLLDVIEHLKDPEVFMETLRAGAIHKRPEIVMTTANIAFFITRLMLLFGQFNYGRKGILDRTHTRLFTFRSLFELFEQTGYKVIEVRGIPAPFPKAIGDNIVSRFLLLMNQALIKIPFLRGLFSYQIFVRGQARPTVPNLLDQTISTSEKLREEIKVNQQAA
ncbi:MAG: hypothetical protein ABMA01_06655, partial [Chthoniobacteraceae bacterium]